MKNLKRLILLSLIFISTIAFGQKVGMTVAKYKEVTTAQKNAFTVPSGENWRVYDTDTGQNEWWDGDSWEPLDTNTLTTLSIGTVTATTYGITSDGGVDDLVLVEANTTQAGLLGADKWDEIVANTLKPTETAIDLSSKNYSWGQSYIENWSKSVLDLGATYFPNNGGYEIGRLHQAETKTSLHFIPAAVGEGVIYAIGKNRVNDLDVSNSVSTYVDEDGIIQTAAIDFARIDYTDGDGAFLFEDASINLSYWSEDFSQWFPSLVTITNNDIISPDGTLNADKFEFTGAGTIQIPNQVTFVDDYVFSCFIKKGNSKYVTVISDNITTEIQVGFDLDLVTAETNGVIEEYVNGWFRLSISTNVTGDADKTGVFKIRLPNSLGGLVSVSGNYAYAWGGQSEEGTVATSYIKTEGTTVTRLADVINGAGDSNTFNSVNGSFKVNIRALSNDLTVRTISTNDSTASNAITIGYSTASNTILAEYIISGSPVASLTYQVSDITEYHDIEFQYALNDFKLLIDDVERDTDVSGAVLSAGTLNSLDYHNGASSNSFFGKQKQLIIQK